MKRKFYRRITFFLGIISFLLVAFLFEKVKEISPFVEVSFFNIGEGDSILIEIPYSFQILIDGGGDFKILEKLKKEISFFDRKIEILILTHPDKDHALGLFPVLERYEIDYVFLPKILGDLKEKPLYENFLNLAQRKAKKIIFAKKGQKVFVGKKVKISFLWPKENFLSSQSNDFSLVFLFSFGRVDFLFTGDAPKRIEKEILKEEEKIESEILKIAHHGSRYSTSFDFLKKVSPKIAIISVGKNPYGHPSKEVLNLLSLFDIKTFRTDFDGDIKVISDGKNFFITK